MRTHQPLILCTLLLGSALALADDSRDAIRDQRSWTIANGNTVEVVRGAARTDAGGAVAGRAFRVTDADGNLVRAGRDRAFRTDDGAAGRASSRTRVNADGDRVTRQRRVRRN